MEPVQPAKMNIYQSDPYRKDLSWLQFDDEGSTEAARKGPTVLHICFCNLSINSKEQLGASMTKVFHAWLYGIFIKIQSNLRIKELHRKNPGSNFLGGTFSNSDNVRAPIKFRRESQSEHLKRWFFLKNKPIHFHIYSTSVIRLAK